MSKFTDPLYLKTDQYRDETNLNARLELHRRFSTNPYGWFPWIVDTLESLPAQARVLELGCGPGYIWKECIERIPAGWSVTLSDLSDGMLDAAWRNLVVTGRAFKFEQIDAQSIPYPDETFDVVIANHMLYHVPDRPKALAEIRRVLKTGGRFIATTVGKRHLVEIDAWIKQISPEADFSPFSNTFTLENGAEQLAPFFTQIETKRYDDGLCVTELEPLMAYIFSTFRASELPESGLEDLQKELVGLLESDGEVFITKDSGMFVACK